MKKPSTIRNWIALGLLLVFAFSIIPRKLLHDALVHHASTALAQSHEASYQTDAASVNCKCQDLFAQPVFVQTPDFSIADGPVFFPDLLIASSEKGHSAQLGFFTRRGPPVRI